jgi:type I restriction enzyme S subunit
LEEFNRIVDPLFEAQQRNGGETDTLVTIRDALLPKLLSGEIRMKQAEKIVGQVV